MSHNIPSRPLLVAIVCIAAVVYETWTVFVRATPALTIRGQHLFAADEFGRGAPVTQTFQMIGNGLSGVDVEFSTDRPLTLIVACELNEIAASGAVAASHAWIATAKRVSGTAWRRIAFPPVAASHRRIFALRLTLIDAMAPDETTRPSQTRRPLTDYPRVGLVASKDNVIGGGELRIGDTRQIGSLSLRVFTREITAYQRFRSAVVPTLPAPLRTPALLMALAVVYQLALVIVVYALMRGPGSAGAGRGADVAPGWLRRAFQAGFIR